MPTTHVSSTNIKSSAVLFLLKKEPNTQHIAYKRQRLYNLLRAFLVILDYLAACFRIFQRQRCSELQKRDVFQHDFRNMKSWIRLL
jgi:hypothetical protein